MSSTRKTEHRLQVPGKAAQRQRLNGLKIAKQDYTTSTLSTKSSLTVRFRFQNTQLLGETESFFPKKLIQR